MPAARALDALDRRGMRLGPVVATPTRWSLLVAPYSMEQLGELLYAKDFVPGSLRFHGEGGYLALPPSETGQRPGPLGAGAAARLGRALGARCGGRRGRGRGGPHSYGCERARVVRVSGARGDGRPLGVVIFPSCSFILGVTEPHGRGVAGRAPEGPA